MKAHSKVKPLQAQPVLLSPDDAIAHLKELLILDVQNPRFATTTVPKAHRLNVDILLKDIAKAQPILLVCLDGQRSIAGAKQLLEKGYTSVYVLQGGVMAWRRAGHTMQGISYPA